MITISDDCSMKLWKSIKSGSASPSQADNDLKIENQVTIETTSCIGITGPKQEYIISGCHSGNIHISKVKYMNDYKTITNAHKNMIRVMLSLKSLGH